MKRPGIQTAGLAAVICTCCQVATSYGGQVLKDGFDGPDFSEAGGLYYRDNFEQSAGTIEFQTAVARNGGALKLSVKPHCSPQNDSAANAPKSGKRPGSVCLTTKASGTALRSSLPIQFRVTITDTSLRNGNAR